MPSAEQLLQDSAWLKRLAFTLAGDRDDAEDLVQESLIAAWRRQPDAGRPMRPWFAKVLRDLAGMKRRAERRRAAREVSAQDDAAREPAAPDALLHQMRLHRLMVDLVLELDEPFRSTVIARFVEGQSSASIARALGIPDGTVRKRLREGLSRLRAGLDASSGGRARWAPAVLAFSKGAIEVAKPTKFVLVVVAALLVMSATTVVLLHLQASSSSPRSTTEVPPATSSVTSPRAVEDGAARLIVAVTDAGGPIAEAAVRCARDDGEVVMARTARDGTAILELAAGEWSVAASAEGREPSAVAVAIAGREARVALVLVVGGRTVTGTVTDASGGPLAGARIDAARLGADTKPVRSIAVAFTDRSGRYRLAIGDGQILVAASHPEYAPQTRNLDLGPSGATANFALVPGGVIEGVVRDAQTKQPVGGAVVRATHDAVAIELAEASERVAKSAADGTFRLAGLRPGAYALSARAGTRRSHPPVRVGLGVAEQQSDIVVLVAATSTIRGKVIDEQGAPAPGVSVRAFAGIGEEGNATSNDAGAFVIEGLPPSRWALLGRSERYLSEGHTVVELKAIDVDGTIVPVRRGLEIRGHVEPREVCDVTLADHDDTDPFTRRESVRATTSADGNFHLAPLALGNVTLVARCRNGDQGTADITVAADAPDRIVRVDAGTAVEGRVRDTLGKPLAGVTVSAECADDNRGLTTIVNGAVTSGSRAITSTDGSFGIRALAPGTCWLTALDRGRPMKAKSGVKLALAPAQHATGVELVVERPAGTIRGTVIGPDGLAVADAWVALYQTDQDLFESVKPGDDASARGRGVRIEGGGGDLPPALSDARGHFEMTSVPHGRYQVIAEARSGKWRGRTADVTPDAEISIQLTPLSSLRGTLHGARGPTELFSVQLTGPTPGWRSFTDGTFEFQRLDPGDYTIEVRSSDGTGKRTAHVSAGGTASLDIALVANATVTGRLVDESGKPVPGMTVVIVPDQPPNQLSLLLPDVPPSSATDGRFHVDGPAGTMMLVILGRPPTVKHELALEAGRTTDVGDVVVIAQP